MYVKTLAYGNATLCPNFEAIGEELFEMVAGSTASRPDIDSIHIRKHVSLRMERRAQI
jgi:hypothetical protein